MYWIYLLLFSLCSGRKRTSFGKKDWACPCSFYLLLLILSRKGYQCLWWLGLWWNDDILWGFMKISGVHVRDREPSQGEACAVPCRWPCRGWVSLRIPGFYLREKVQAWVEQQGFVVLVIGQLEIGTIRVDCISKIRPERKVLGRENGVPLQWVHSARSDERKDLIAEHSSQNTWEQAGHGHMDSLERKHGQRQSPRSLLEQIFTTYAMNPKRAPPVTLSCSAFLPSARMRWRSGSSR